MFGWFKKRKAKVYCPKCEFNFTVSYDKDAEFEPYELEGLPCKKLTTTLCPFCRIELFIILCESRVIGDPKYRALDPAFEKEKAKYSREHLHERLEIEENFLDEISCADDKQTEKKLIDLHNQNTNKYREKYLEWEKRTKEKLGYK